MATATRIYLVTNGESISLIKATVAAQAITHAAKQTFSVRVASQDDLVKALSSGVQVETYGETAQTELTL